MTTIESIKNECRAIIAQAEKATPGPWRRAATFYIGDADDNRVAELMGAKYAIQNVENGDFIAASRSFTPRAAKALLVTIEALEQECAKFNFPDEDRPLCFQALETIRASWEDSK